MLAVNDRNSINSCISWLVTHLNNSTTTWPQLFTSDSHKRQQRIDIEIELAVERYKKDVSLDPATEIAVLRPEGSPRKYSVREAPRLLKL